MLPVSLSEVGRFELGINKDGNVIGDLSLLYAAPFAPRLQVKTRKNVGTRGNASEKHRYRNSPCSVLYDLMTVIPL